MMVTFASECEKKALNRTRRVLDTFANRIGSRTWQTVITNEGLYAVKKLLRKTATKNTAVACHWIRSRSRSELQWIVGKKEKFNTEGFVPVNTTKKDIINTQWENDWHYHSLIKALTAMAALLHDWGKTTALFQDKLKTNSRLGDPVRHEWISCLLLHALITTCDCQDDDTPWLMAIVNGKLDVTQIKKYLNPQEQKPLNQLPPAAKMLSWLIVSHHRMPSPHDRNNWRAEPAPDFAALSKWITQDWGFENRRDEQDYQQRIKSCFEFPNGLINNSFRWMKQLKKWAKRLQACLPLVERSMNDGSYRLLLHHSRLSLMLADHYYSSQRADRNWRDTTGLFANTDRKTKKFNQKLDEHLVGVEKNALHTAHLLPKFEHELPSAQCILALKKPSPKAFDWQNKAVKEIKVWREQQGKSQYGFFAVNLASTGCGKTFANAKVMRALSSDGDSLRYILALGLRTLTLQTGNEYRKRIGLDDSELAVLIGSKAIMELHNQSAHNDVFVDDEQLGSESLEPLLSEDIDFDCDIPEEGFATVLKQKRDRQFLYSPVLACTIDHMMAATETRRGGRYILPSLRLMSSDLVIDEVDDFTGSDLIAIGRLIHLAGMLGRKVMISSATIPPDLAEGYFNAYRAGWKIYSQTNDASGKIGCAWIDEFITKVTSISKTNNQDAIESYRDNHREFILKRVKKLAQQPVKRKADLINCQSIVDRYDFDSEETRQEQYFAKIQHCTLDKHQQHHTEDKQTGIKVSFGVVRMANIRPCVALSKYLMGCNWPENFIVKVMTYHSQQVLLLRHEQEQHLDSVLKRKEKACDQPEAFSNTVIRGHLDKCTSKHLLFIVVATPVEEVGRDHDFDWAIIEPSSYRSIIQLAGRVRRHREGEVDNPNIALLQYNWKTVKEGNQPLKKYFCRPGYEDNLQLNTHDLCELIDCIRISQSIDAIPRIQKPKHLDYKKSLADLEHKVTEIQLTNYKGMGPEKMQGYLTESWYLTALPQALNPFRKNEQTTNLFLMYEQDGDRCIFVEKDEQGYPINREGILQIRHRETGTEKEKAFWLQRDYKKLLEQYSERDSSSKKKISLRYGELNFVHRDYREYEYSDQFGLISLH
ncbi:type I-F CRISPR-associated helicase Cas3f [candidate division CSSED10-310 bacterium]|uniref:Type I-F CRISPR-associated helicase Cas3f n=1 Tax=candidate division CSSED10-310 bacterium TaxID=2855610 RepID=A0ABV6YZS8_UNCC1